jgi:putative hydrolase of the HAD superfamily
MALVSTLRLVSFDATNTLMTLCRPVGAQYRELLSQHMAAAGASSAIDGVTEEAIEAAFLKAYKQRMDDAACFGVDGMGSTEWWRVLVRNTWVGAGVSEAALAHGAGIEAPLFESLWEHFAGNGAWELLPGAQGLLQRLDDYRREQRATVGRPRLQLGVVSDWDERLPSLLEKLEIADHFDFINAAYTIGHAKPASEAFEAALAAAGGTSAADALHIGDSLSRDVRGALEAGMQAVLLGPVGEGSEAAALLEKYGVERLHVCEGGLAGLPALLGLDGDGGAGDIGWRH